jgi:hypothetical protein
MRAIRFRTGAVAGLMLTLLAGAAVAQAPPLRHLDDVKKLPGVPVAQARTGPETALRLTAYRIEQVSLPEAYTVWVAGRKTEVTTGFKVTVSFAAPLTVRDQAFSLVIDGRWCGFLQEAPDLLSADTVCFDRALIREGAALGVTYRAVQIQSPPADEKQLGADVSVADPSEAVHYSSVRLRLGASR